MRRVLILSYHFPPVGGAGVQRSAELVRYLFPQDYQPIVVTGPGPAGDRWTPTDETLAAEIPQETEILRADGHPESAPPWRRSLERWLTLPSAFSRWWVKQQLQAGFEAAPVDVIYASLAPYESAYAAAGLTSSLGVPAVVDLRDPWALDEMMVFPTRLHRAAEAAKMRRALRASEAIVASTPEAELRIRTAFPELRDKLIVTIPNGYDPADFENPPPQRTDSAFRIVHTGYLHTELGLKHRKTVRIRELLGGSVKGLDILTRSHVYLLEAVDRLIREDPSLASTIEVHLAGVLTDTDRRIAEDSPVVRLLGYVAHHETVDLVRTADLLFLPMHDLPPGTRASIVPGKTYEYIASGRPILAAVPDGDARDILEEAGTAHLCRPADTNAMFSIIRSALERWRAGVEPPAPNPAVLERFDYRNLARELAGVFDQVVEASSYNRRPA